MLNIYHWNRGRLGNSLFRYFATAYLCNKGDLGHKYNSSQYKEKYIEINDEQFHLIINNSIPVPDCNILLTGFTQYDELFKYRKEILKYMKTNDNDILYTDRNDSYRVKDLLMTDVPVYDIVLHIRLEDFVENNEFIPVDKIVNLLDTIHIKDSICIVVKEPISQFEKEYIQLIVQYLEIRNITTIINNNNIITDFKIMRNCKKLICSKSTISWCAAFLSEDMECCYMPDYSIIRNHQTIKTVHENTIMYYII
jgi:hypothetical protein